MDKESRKRALTLLRVRRFRDVRHQTQSENESRSQILASRSGAGSGSETSEYDSEGQVDNENNMGPIFNETQIINDTEDNQQSMMDDQLDDNEGSIDESDDNIAIDNEFHFENSEEYSEDESEDLDEIHSEGEEWNEVTELRNWAISSNIPHTRLDILLGILRKRLLPELPACSKTFLKTASADYYVQSFRSENGCADGEFVYFGIAKHLKNTVNTNLHEDNVLHLQFNIDGLPLYKSSSRQFWPILCKVQFQPDVYEPFPVAIQYSGVQKPSNVNEYLGSFIEEINGLMDTGIAIDEKQFKICVACFICDRPARSFVKCIKGHGGYYACERCTVKGERREGRTIYTSISCEERSDESFRNEENPEHHNSFSPIVLINPRIDMVFQFVLDFMHLCCLGIMKKLLVDCWLQGILSTKLSYRSKVHLSQRLISLQTEIPAEFQRTTRSIFDVAKWQATEFRFFLLYSGPVVLKKILPDVLYKHFLLFSIACRILCSKKLAVRYNEQAKLYLRSFVSTAQHLYGKSSMVMNMHSLIHLADDVKTMGCPVSEYTAFPFENLLGKMKKMLRSGRRPLAQLCRRMHEAFFTNKKKVTLPQHITILRKLHQTPTGITPIKRLKYHEATITCKSPDNVVQLGNGKLLRIDNMYIPANSDVNGIEISGSVLRFKRPMFVYPCHSMPLMPN